MKKNILRLAIFFLSLQALSASAQTQSLSISSSTLFDIHKLETTPLPSSSTTNVSLTVFPENLKFQISWGPVDVGWASLEVEKIIGFSGQNAYHIVSRAKSNSFCDGFYKVRDLNESWLSTQDLSSLGYSKNLKEGSFFRKEWTVFNQKDHSFLSRTVSKQGTISYSTGPILPQIQDILSSLYYIRSKTLIPGKSVTLNVNTKKNWPLIVRVIRKEKVSVPAGSFDTILVEPLIRKHGIFVQKGRRLQVWLTDDAQKTPVQMKVDILFGHVTASLLPRNKNSPGL